MMLFLLILYCNTVFFLHLVFTCVQNYKELELLRLVYYGGVEHGIRKEVWPFLLGHYKFGMGKSDMSQVHMPAQPHTHTHTDNSI